MASYLAVAVVLFFLSGAGADQSSTSRRIQQACKATRFPESCETSLKNSGLVQPDPSPFQIVRSALALSSKNLETSELMVRAVLQYSTGNPNRTAVAHNCLEALGNAEYRLNSTAEVLSRGRMKDARAWTGGALSYFYDCWSGLKRVNDEPMVNKTVSFFNETLMTSTSNVLSMMMSYDEYGNRTGSWVKPMTERDGFWESVGGGSRSGREMGIPLGLTADVTVCHGGGCTYETVQAAVDAASENLSGRRRFVVKIKEGVYGETVRVPLRKRNLVFLGDGMGKTVITGSLHVGHGLSTYNTATVGILGDGFMARDLTIQNTAGPEAHQAVAFRSDSDLSVIENCEFIGNQDTLYVHSLRQLYKSCIIQGNVDFIFGNSASVFQNCTIVVRPRQHAPEHGETNAITAHGRTDPAQMTGLVFHDCIVNGTDEYMRLYHNNPSVHKTYLGRPWKEYSRVIFVNCQLEELVSPHGWMAWDGEFALKTLYFGEFGNSGLGSNVSGRVPWSSQIPNNHVNAYSVHNFIQSEEWNMLTYSNHFEINV